MKKLTLSTISALFAIAVLAQAPQGISHQAVIRNAANELVINAPIGIQVSILQGSADGTVVYSETHLPTSNANGLISFIIGQGTVVNGVFAEIDWSDGPYFIKTQADPSGGINYTIEGISQMLSVPYALNANHANHANHASSLTLANDYGMKYQLSIDENGNLTTSVLLGQSCPGTPTITDRDGNVYNTVLIGTQCWLKENLKTTKYNNGTQIEYPGSNNTAWENNTTGAYAWYDNDISWKDSYGALYNWHAVNNTNGLCPAGWHVPSDADLTQLVDYVVSQGYPNQEDEPNGAGNALKSCREVDSPLGGECNTTEHPRWFNHFSHHGFDAFGFSGLPGGRRLTNGSFQTLGGHVSFWSSTEGEPSTHAWRRSLNGNAGNVWRFSTGKGYGSSVRCKRDYIPGSSYLHLEAEPSEAGTVVGAGHYQAGEEVTLSATTNPGWEFVNWSDADGIVSEAAIFTYTMPAVDITLTANFEMIDYTLTLTANPNEGGSVSGGGVYNFGEEVPVSANANTSYTFVNWTDANGVVSQAPNFLYTMPAADVTLTANFFTCGNSFTDSRDNQSYNTLQLGAQCWMAENLKYLPEVVGAGTGSNTVPYYYVYGYNGTSVSAAKATANYQTYGALYNWPASLTACPSGWHLPTDAEWTALTTYVSSQPAFLCNSNTSNIAKSLAATTNWLTDTGTCTVGNNLSANNATGFSGLPGGNRYNNGPFNGVGSVGNWWSSTQGDATDAWSRTLYYFTSGVSSFSLSKGFGLSARCVRD